LPELIEPINSVKIQHEDRALCIRRDSDSEDGHSKKVIRGSREGMGETDARRQKTELTELIDNLKRFRDDLEKCGHDYSAETFFSIMRSLMSYLAGINDPLTIELFRDSKYFRDYRSFFIARQRSYYHKVELAEALSLKKRLKASGQSMLEIFDQEFSRNAYRRIEDALRFVDFSLCRTFVMVGCGPLPATLFCIRENTDVRDIVGLDSNREAADSAGELIDCLKLTGIKVKEANGTEFDYQKADVIYVANLVSPKRVILSQILKTARKDVRIILRDPYGAGILLAESGMEDLDSRFRCIGEGMENEYFLSKHFFLAS
jgi:hypothetical protein